MKAVWSDFRGWPASAQITTWVLAVTIIFALPAGCANDEPTKVKVKTSSTTSSSSTSVPVQSKATTAPAPTTAPITTTPPPETTAAPPPPPPSPVYYKNCTEARNAGAAPVHIGDPGYGSHLDRDGDGIGCE